jgi:hypothetical protein
MNDDDDMPPGWYCPVCFGRIWHQFPMDCRQQPDADRKRLKDLCDDKRTGYAATGR